MENLFKTKATNWNIQVDTRKLKTDLFTLMVVRPFPSVLFLAILDVCLACFFFFFHNL